MVRSAIFLAVLVSCACERKAPGPAECQGFAARALGIRSNQDLRLPGALEKLDELTRECLTTPFDRALLRCVELGGGARRCLVDFERRRSIPGGTARLSERRGD